MHALPDLGVGLVLWPELMPVLAEDDGAIGVVEIEPEFFWFETGNAQAPMRIDTGMVRQLAELPQHKLVHGVASPVGGSLAPEPQRLQLMREVVQALGAPWASEHLSFNAVPVAGGPVDSGFLLPPLQTVASAQQAAANIRTMAQGLRVPFAVENNVNYLRPVAGELSDGAFIAEVATQADCGILLDLHNLWTNQKNGRQPVREALAALPLERVCELHLAGGFAHRGYWLDAHSGLVDEELMRLAAELMPALPNLHAIVFEMLPTALAHVGIADVRRQIDRLHTLWALRRPGARAPQAAAGLARGDGGVAPSPADWERTLGALVRGDAPGAHPIAALLADPGVALLRELASNARAGQIASAARLTTRMLLAHGGEAAFRSLFEDYAAAQPPRQFASSEALGFLEHVQLAAPAIPQLAQVAMFESAVIHSALQGDARVVAFDRDPVPLLTALAERRAPPPAQAPGRFAIELQGGAVIAIRAG
ncbi:DUF692 family protein [Xanthomonas sp. CFBP 8703]|uniref:DUF692 family protein n=1 Tax=Xanthomonas bonasiae TaxID=2810351 RepID=A0ABS3B8X7_9XANT|nr:DUF692 family multinuclear iron-containing protein [Xanthomonas bonasiae]MBN6104717.1 DUF692 family protein [Xanthomonas bonasiae]